MVNNSEQPEQPTQPEQPDINERLAKLEKMMERLTSSMAISSPPTAAPPSQDMNSLLPLLMQYVGKEDSGTDNIKDLFARRYLDLIDKVFLKIIGKKAKKELHAKS